MALKTKITPIYKLWENEIKFFLSDYELIDCHKKYIGKYPPIINH